MREAIRVRHYSRRTEEAYVVWIGRFILFHGKRHRSGLGAPEVAAFVSSLATERDVSPSTQNQALSAVLFLYRHVLGISLDEVNSIVRASARRRLPVVLSRREGSLVMAHLEGPPWLVVSPLYGAGLRLLEALDLRVKDLDLELREIAVREGRAGRIAGR